jgi:phosphoribosylformylglycinamidine cyclo-ligase
MQKLGSVAETEMFKVFNMGIGFVVICAPSFANSIVHQLAASGITATEIGEVKNGEVGVEIA